jgi:hypothetical protein
MLTAKCVGAVAPALEAAPSLLASVDWQIARRQRVPPATIVWDIRSPDLAAIDIGEVDDAVLLVQSTPPLPFKNQ